jgi:DNA-binding transcriptional regulator of glucitol operon
MRHQEYIEQFARGWSLWSEFSPAPALVSDLPGFALASGWRERERFELKMRRERVEHDRPGSPRVRVAWQNGYREYPNRRYRHA